MGSLTTPSVVSLPHFAAGATEALGTALTAGATDAEAEASTTGASGTATVAAAVSATTAADDAAGAGASVDAQATREHAITSDDNLIILENLL